MTEPNLDEILRRIAYWNGYDSAGEWERTGHEVKAQLEEYIANQVAKARYKSAIELTAHYEQLITAHTNAEIAKVLDRAKQRFHEPIEHDGSYISISVIDKTFDELIQAERAKLKER